MQLYLNESTRQGKKNSSKCKGIVISNRKLQQIKNQIERVEENTRSVVLNPHANIVDVRFFVLHVPASIQNLVDKSKQFPLLLFFHGKGE